MNLDRAVPIVGLALLIAFNGASVEAHPLSPSSLRLRVDEAGLVEVIWRVPSTRPIGQVLAPVLPAHCEPLGPPEAVMTEDRTAIEERWRVDCGERGLVGSTISVRGLTRTTTNVVVEVTLPGGATARGLLHRGDTGFVVHEGQGSASVMASYLRLGVEHLLSGPDHVVFVLGLLLLLGAGRKLVQAITAFTLGHSLSLCLSVLGIVRVPSPPVEIAIALTILVLALDIQVGHRRGEPGPIARWPWVLCTVFGLLHGLGFAGALAHAGLPEHAIPLSLLSFNLGIEVGQLLIVVVAFGLAWPLRKRLADRPRLTRVAPAYVIGSLAAFWVLERGLGALGVL
jgi:hydrogenase/urease accessory protein HupE